MDYCKGSHCPIRRGCARYMERPEDQIRVPLTTEMYDRGTGECPNYIKYRR